MKIKTVGYGRTINTGNYESIRYYLEADVEEGEHWFFCLNQLLDKINELEGNRKHILDVDRECEQLERRKERTQAQLDRLQSQLKGLLGRIEEVNNFLKQHGIDPLTTPTKFFLPQPQEPTSEENIGEEDLTEIEF